VRHGDVLVASQTPDHLACRPRHDRNLNVSQTFSRNFDMMSSRARQSNQSLRDSIANNDDHGLSRVASRPDHRRELQQRTKKGLEVEKK
jgi:hypothetical protein